MQGAMIQLLHSDRPSSQGDDLQDQGQGHDEIDGEVKVMPMSVSDFKGSDISPGTTPLADSVFGSISVSSFPSFSIFRFEF